METVTGEKAIGSLFGVGRSALEEAGIPALVEGDLLQGALGELPVGWSTAPRIMVEEADASKARALLERWESGGRD